MESCIGDVKGSQVVNPLSLNFLEATMSGLRVSALVDIGTTHSLVSSRMVSSLHSLLEGNQARFKAVNLEMKTVKGRINTVPLTVGSWQGKVDLEFVPLDDHSVILGHGFLW